MWSSGNWSISSLPRSDTRRTIRSLSQLEGIRRRVTSNENVFTMKRKSTWQEIVKPWSLSWITWCKLDIYRSLLIKNRQKAEEIETRPNLRFNREREDADNALEENLLIETINWSGVHTILSSRIGSGGRSALSNKWTKSFQYNQQLRIQDKAHLS